MTNPHHGVDVAARIEVRLKLHPDRIGGGNQIIKYAVGDLFMGDRLVAEAVDVKLDRLELNHPLSRLIDQAQDCKIRIAREGTLTGEFRQFDRYLIGTAWPRVIEADQLGFGDGTVAVEGCLGQEFRGCSGCRQ